MKTLQEPATPASSKHVPEYELAARQNLTTVELVDVEIDRCRRYRASAANDTRRNHYESRLRFLTKLRGEVATPTLFACV